MDTWLGAMPASVVQPGDETKVADEMLVDVPLPPGFDKSKLPSGGSNDYYQYGARVTGQVTCGWIADRKVSQGDGNTVGMKRAADAMATSHHWKVLKKMDADGDYPEVIWEYAHQLVAGEFPSGYKQGLGCD